MKRTILQLTLMMLFFIAIPSVVKAEDKEAGQAAQLLTPTASSSAEAKPIDIRVKKLSAYLRHYNSPLVDDAQIFVDQADKYGLDWKFVVSIAGVESTFGQFIPTGSYNPFGWGVFTGQSYGANFPDWPTAIATVSAGLKANYLDKGATTVDSIGYLYASSPAWSTHIRFFMNDLDTFPMPEDITPKAIAMTL